MAQDLLLMFVFWDITAIASYYLIGYDRADADSRYSALMALLVTGVTSVFFLIAALLLSVEYETFALADLIARATPGPTLTIAGILIALAALAKSAQAPFQFWLPRVMAAPTPVSAYLHSAAMIAAGVFLFSRTYPLLQQSEFLLNALLAIGFLSMLTGGILALASDILKRVLAYSTIAQYGYVVFLLGLGSEVGAIGAAFYVLAHALGKCCLFLTAGAVTEATGEKHLSELGGLYRSLPWLAVGSGAAAAGLAALPATIGFFKDELLFDAAFEQAGPLPRWP
jgi:multicomponent Na+:H+ antiporter subunit A